MCKACQVSPRHPPHSWATKDTKRACREGQKKVPFWLAPKRTAKAELTYQLNRLAGNAKWEVTLAEAA